MPAPPDPSQPPRQNSAERLRTKYLRALSPPQSLTSEDRATIEAILSRLSGIEKQVTQINTTSQTHHQNTELATLRLEMRMQQLQDRIPQRMSPRWVVILLIYHLVTIGLLVLSLSWLQGVLVRSSHPPTSPVQSAPDNLHAAIERARLRSEIWSRDGHELTPKKDMRRNSASLDTSSTR